MKIHFDQLVGSRLTRLTAAALLALGTAGPASALTGTLVVHGPPGGGNTPPTVACNNPTTNGGWLINDVPAFPVQSNFVTGPGSPPLGTGSLNETVSGSSARALLFTSFGGTSLSVLASFLSPVGTAYSLNPATASGGEAVLALFVSYDGGATIGDQLLYIPALNSCFAPGMWTTCSFLSGVWKTAVAGPTNPHDPTGAGGTFALSSYIGFPANSGAVVPSLAAMQPTLALITSGAMGLNANVDNFSFTSVGPVLSGPFTSLQWDFEADCTNYGGDSDSDCYCDSLNPLVANRDTCAGVSNALCTGAGTPTDCCTGTGTGTCDVQTDSDGDGLGDVCDNCPSLGNGSCTAAGIPDECCTGMGTGTCTSQTDTDMDGIGDVCDSACPDTPDSCESAAKNSLKVRSNSDAARQVFQWKWKGSTNAVNQADFGDPVDGGSQFTVCVYDETAGTPELKMEMVIAPGGTCGDADCWDSTSRDKGWSYKNKSGNGDSVRRLRLNGGAAGKGSIQIEAKGANVPIPAAASMTELFDQDTDVTVQLHSSGSASCWSSTFTTPKKNDGEQYSATNNQ